MWNSCSCEIHTLHLTTSAICTLANAVRNTTRFANANTDAPAAITHDHHRAEGKTTSTLDHFGDALDVNDALIKFFAVLTLAWFTRLTVFALLSIFHSLPLEFQTAFTSAPSSGEVSATESVPGSCVQGPR